MTRHISVVLPYIADVQRALRSLRVPMAQSKAYVQRWCFTAFEVDRVEAALRQAWRENREMIQYLVFGLEECPTTSRKHLQGYICLNVRMRWNQLKELLGSRSAHVEPSKGSPSANREYCMKDGKAFEFGKCPEISAYSGGRALKKKWSDAWEKAKKGDIATVASSIRVGHYLTLKRIHVDHSPLPVNLPPGTICGIYLMGPPGVGKSHLVREVFPNAYWKDQNKWWDGYQSESVAIVEDLDPSRECIGVHLKIWSDRYSFRGEVKGGSINLRPRWIVITSNYSIPEIWDWSKKGNEKMSQALTRRFHIFHMTHREEYEYIKESIAAVTLISDIELEEGRCQNNAEEEVQEASTSQTASSQSPSQPLRG